MFFVSGRHGASGAKGQSRHSFTPMKIMLTPTLGMRQTLGYVSPMQFEKRNGVA